MSISLIKRQMCIYVYMYVYICMYVHVMDVNIQHSIYVNEYFSYKEKNVYLCVYVCMYVLCMLIIYSIASM